MSRQQTFLRLALHHGGKKQMT